MSPNAGGSGDRLRRAAAAVRVPADVLSKWHDAPPSPEPGQLWRARWREVAELVVIVESLGRSVRAVPVRFDVDYADDSTVVLPAAASPLGIAFAAWLGLGRELPTRALDRCLGALDERWRRTDVEDAFEFGEQSRGIAIVSAADIRNEYRARIEDALDTLMEAAWSTPGDGTLGQRLLAAGVTPDGLVTLLDIEPQDALAILRNRAPVTSEQAQRLVDIMGCPATEILDSNPAPPDDLLARLEQPHRRWQVLRFAEKRVVPEEAAWQMVTFGVWRMAARQTGHGQAPAWDDRLDRYFHVTLDDE